MTGRGGYETTSLVLKFFNWAGECRELYPVKSGFEVVFLKEKRKNEAD